MCCVQTLRVGTQLSAPAPYKYTPLRGMKPGVFFTQLALGVGSLLLATTRNSALPSPSTSATSGYSCTVLLLLRISSCLAPVLPSKIYALHSSWKETSAAPSPWKSNTEEPVTAELGS